MTNNTPELVIHPTAQLSVGDVEIEIIEKLDRLSMGIDYFRAKILADDRAVLLRVGSVDGGLGRELKLREVLGQDNRMVCEVLACETRSSVRIQLEATPPASPVLELDTDEQLNLIADSEEETEPETEEENAAETEPETTDSKDESDFLEEEIYPEKEFDDEPETEKLLLVTPFLESDRTLATWLDSKPELEEILRIAAQLSQFFSQAIRENWCFIDLVPQLIKKHTPIVFFDLTYICSTDTTLEKGLMGGYCPPELAHNLPVTESASTYVVGAFLYRAIAHEFPPENRTIEIDIPKIPRLYQLLKICLSPAVEERFPLAQLVQLIVEIRKSLQVTTVSWNIARRSTVGLSVDRLQNEDNYGVRQQQIASSQAFILAVVADGMGGMASGEVASKLAVETLLKKNLDDNCKTVEGLSNWLVEAVSEANSNVSREVKDGGTTLSAVAALDRDLLIAHVGDSRIYLLRKGELHQLSEDHSFVAMLVANGEITTEEARERDDRNLLIKSIGSKSRLSEGYVQTLKRTGDISKPLEDGDIILLCSDGVWDLISDEEFATQFTKGEGLQTTVDKTIDLVLDRGSPDNATLVVLQFHCSSTSRY